MPAFHAESRRACSAASPAPTADLRIVTALFVLLAVLVPRVDAACAAVLQNRGLTVQFNAGTGAISEVENRLTGETYKAKSLPFSIETSAGVLQPGAASCSQPSVDSISFEYDLPRARAVVTYRAPAETDFIRASLALTNTGTERIVIYRVNAGQFELAPALREMHPHYDPSQFKWLINVFLRGAKGGFFAGVETPVYHFTTKGHTSSSSWLQFHYEPNVPLAASDTFTSDKFFLGAYRNEGVYVFKELAKLKRAMTLPKAVGTALNYDQEILDWGEVWGMQDYIRSVEPPHDFKQPGFYVRVVAMVGGSKSASMGEDAGFHIPFAPKYVAGSERFIDEIVKLGHIPHVEWATEWFGNGGYGNPTPGFNLENAGPSDPTPVNPSWEEVVKYGQQKGISAGIFETASRNFARHEEKWKVRKRDGTPWTWTSGKYALETNCWADREYAKWRLEVTDRAIRDFNLYMVAWDAIVPADWSWLGWPDMRTECWATSHGHEPGDITYPIYRNIRWFLDELQKRHPKVALRVASGLTTFYPWVLTHLIEYHPDFYDGETGATYWTSYNFRFLPMYKSGVLLSGTTRNQFEWLLLRSISVSDHFMLWPDAVNIAMENRGFWTKWLRWADENIEYLRVGRTMFREPWGDHMVASLPPALEGSLPAPEAGINGSAHCIKDRGFLFLFNPSAGTRIASIPLNHWIGLTEGGPFAVTQLYPGDTAYGLYKRGAELRVEMPANSAMVLKIAPDSSGAATSTARAGATAGRAPVDKAFLRWNEIPWNEIEARP